MEAVRAGADAIAQWRAASPDVELDLSGADLRGLDLQRVRLENANLAGASVINVTLFWADPKGANLQDAMLRHCRMNRV